MKRRSVPYAAQVKLFSLCRRRCCICFGLERITKLQSGQIAHLDKDRSNCEFDNLAFLCLSHHDEYDSVSSQRKNFVAAEIKLYRNELIEALDNCFGAPVAFGEATFIDRAVGQYIRVNDDSTSAEILISQLLDGRYHVSGAAFSGPNLNHGLLDFIARMSNRLIVYEESFDSGVYQLQIQLGENDAKVVDTNNASFGAHVRFEGVYERVGGFGRYESLF